MNEIVRPMYGTVVSLDICKSTKIFEKSYKTKMIMIMIIRLLIFKYNLSFT